MSIWVLAWRVLTTRLGSANTFPLHLAYPDHKCDTLQLSDYSTKHQQSVVMSVICVCTAASGSGSFYLLFACSLCARVWVFTRYSTFYPRSLKMRADALYSYLNVTEWCASCNKLMICAGCSPAFYPVILQHSPWPRFGLSCGNIKGDR